ncbi:diacylglycerol acyltransferase-domain-containing protein [Limtongia smithiae]|uniref:diacylglycerol acyltransferase-domain-containing protein n=1 Tax=Limtongia smithiae TaxID=1125753 RepID=UPI0034CD1DF5
MADATTADPVEPLLQRIKESFPRRIHFAPLNIPLERRLETLAVLGHVLSLLYCVGLFFLISAFPPFWPFVVAYLYYAYIVDYNTSENGEVAARRRSPLMRRLPWFRLYCDYFPIRIHREVELPPTFPDRLVEPSGTIERWVARFFGQPEAIVDIAGVSTTNGSDVANKVNGNGNGLSASLPNAATAVGPRYVFGYHPHGIVSLGAFGAIGTEGAGWERLFPGIPVSLLTLETNFRLPLYRDYLLSLGISSVSRKSCTSLLDHNQSICIVVGGARESLLAEPSRLDLIISKRKGFVRLAMKSKPPVENMTMPATCLVPILSFGENDVYEQVRGDTTSMLYKFQTLVKTVAGFTVPLLHARGIFNYDWGLMPYRRPITVVVGKPIAVPYTPEPTESEIDVYHKQYCEELRRLWDTYKDAYFADYVGLKPEEQALNFVE